MKAGKVPMYCTGVPPPPVEVSAEEVEVQDMAATEVAAAPIDLDEVPF